MEDQVSTEQRDIPSTTYLDADGVRIIEDSCQYVVPNAVTPGDRESSLSILGEDKSSTTADNESVELATSGHEDVPSDVESVISRCSSSSTLASEYRHSYRSSNNFSSQTSTSEKDTDRQESTSEIYRTESEDDSIASNSVLPQGKRKRLVSRQKYLYRDEMKFMKDFDPYQRLEKTRMKKYTIGVSVVIEKCDCLIPKCVGCHYPCKLCQSRFCGHECRYRRRWHYDEIEVQGRGITRKWTDEFK